MTASGQGAIWRWLAGGVVVVHCGFVLFVALGGLAVWRWPRAAWAHLPAVAWGVWIEVSGGICPLTPLENHLRQMGGEATYTGDFIGQHLLPVLYPEGLTRPIQWGLAALVAVLNGAIYARLALRLRRRSAGAPAASWPGD